MRIEIAKIIESIIAKEGGYVDNSSDRGGKTRWGITEAVARSNGYAGDMSELPVDFAKQIYYKKYIRFPKFDLLLDISCPVAVELIDTGVNMGMSTATMFLQRALNALTHSMLRLDGDCGAKTREALQAFIDKRGKDGEVVLLRALNGLQCERYITLAERDGKQKTFLFGWIKNRVEL